MNQRLFVKKKDPYLVESRSLEKTLKEDLGLSEDFRLTKYNIYDIFNAEDSDLQLLKKNVIAETVTDEVIENPDFSGREILAYEYLPGQYDQRADSAMQCLMLLNQKKDVRIKSGTLIEMEDVTPEQKEAIAAYLINPVEARKKDLNVLDDSIHIDIKPVARMEGFLEKDEAGLEAIRKEMGLAMSLEDLAFVQDYFINTEKRIPSVAEIRVLDTYWSDHCRHTTFETMLKSVSFEDRRFKDQIQKAYEDYLAYRKDLKREEKPVTLMDMATIAGRVMRADGRLADEEISDEINACSIEIPVDVNGETETWLLMFKNETHNHPTEIEPFGGASTCIGGAIRDPLSGRSYVYQAMRITGAGDITAPLSKTLPNKLPQSKISKTAAAGYSSYGNQIGLATTFVDEIFDEGYQAKRMEVGAVVGAAPKSHVKREKPAPGDLIVLVGGATGRDGIGGATGSSKEHTDASLSECSSEVQKGNALIERKLQRLFRNPNATTLIKKANDFGAGGVSVAIGELADGLSINLDAVPVKYEGLDGTELAISESQERMAVCIEAKDFEAFAAECEKENLEAIVVAVVEEEPRLVMNWKGDTIVDMARSFLDTNGVRQSVDVLIEETPYNDNPFEKDDSPLLEKLKEDNIACQIGLAEMFDASIGKSTILMPFGGRLQRTPEEGSVQKLPVDGFTDTCSIMAYGYDPKLSKYSPFLGAQYSVVEALARLASLGADTTKARLTNQEYFERLGSDPKKWGAPTQALLGLIKAEMAMETPAIGGKDSMSGTFKDIHVPPTLITFAIAAGKSGDVISASLKEEGDHLYLLKHQPLDNHEPDYEALKKNFASLKEENAAGNVNAAKSVKYGAAAALALMAMGNEKGFEVELDDPNGFNMGSIIVETKEPVNKENWIEIGKVKGSDLIINGKAVPVNEAFEAWSERYDSIYPRNTAAKEEDEDLPDLNIETHDNEPVYSSVQYDHPKVLIPVFPGQNCEYDTRAKFERAGGDVEVLVLNNTSVEKLQESIEKLARAIEEAQILMIVGGFSLGDEPDGSGKFIANILQNEQVAAAIEKMLAKEGLILGICNGFQALIKSGLLPAGKPGAVDENSPTLFRNDINRHVSHIASTRLVSNRSPWLAGMEPGHVYSVAMSHGEGKFMADGKTIQDLIDNDQIAFQYVDENGNPTMDGDWNINGSVLAIEGITSKDGHILGKMGHSERYEDGLFQNITGDKDQNLFENGIRFFTHKKK